MLILVTQNGRERLILQHRNVSLDEHHRNPPRLLYKLLRLEHSLWTGTTDQVKYVQQTWGGAFIAVCSIPIKDSSGSTVSLNLHEVAKEELCAQGLRRATLCR